MNECVKEDSKYYILIGNVKNVLRVLFVLLSIAVVMIEGYYIFILRDKIVEQKEETENISLQLQLLKIERDSLNEELSSIKKLTGENRYGRTTKREH